MSERAGKRAGDSPGNEAELRASPSRAQQNDVSQIRSREPLAAIEPEQRNARILVVDDVEGNRDLLARRLRRKGYETESAVDGEHAIEVLGSAPFDLVMLDIMMPGINGFDVLRWIRRRWSSIELPVIMQSARDERDSMVDAFALGANDYVTKPIDFAVAESRVRTHLQLKRSQQLLQRRNDFIRNVFGRYVTCDVVNRLLEQPDGLKLGGELRTVTILFCDIRGFSSLSESLSPEQVVALLNAYLGSVSDVVEQHGGCVNEFIGDAVLAIFNAPAAIKDHQRHAVACALAIQRAMDDVNQRLVSMSLPTIEIGVGVHTGECVVGNTGSERRAKYGVVGTPVNVAARIEALTVGGQVLVSDVTALGTGCALEVVRSYDVSVKGASGPLHLQDVVGFQSDRSMWLPRISDSLSELPSIVPCRLSVLTGKRICDQEHSAVIDAVSPRGARMRTEDVRLRALDDVRLQIPTVRSGSGLYAKVVQVEDGHVILRFTSVPRTTGLWLAALLRIVNPA